MKKIVDQLQKNKALCLLIVISCFLNLLVFYHLGYRYNLGSDDLSYVESGIEFLKTGKIGIHGYEQTAQIMPGMPILISIFAFLFGTGNLFWIFLKLFWLFMATLSICILYKIIRMFAGEIISFCVTCFLFAADFLWVNQLILTETPFMLSFLFLIYYTLKLEKERNFKNFWLLLFWYLFGIMIRPNIGIYPVFVFFYLLIKKYNFSLMIKQGLIALTILILILIPWTIRNYQVFHRFVPLTYGTGNPLLLGTYQGNGYPLDEELDYQTEVDSKLSDEMKQYLFDESQELSGLLQYYKLEYDGLKAKYRMQEWWKQDPKSMIKSYLIQKPKIMLRNSFYWDPIFHIPEKVNFLFRDIDLILTVIAIGMIIIFKKYRAELFLLLSTYLAQILLYSYTFAFSRYAQTLYFLRFIIIGIGMGLLYQKYLERKKKNEIIT